MEIRDDLRAARCARNAHHLSSNRSPSAAVRNESFTLMRFVAQGGYVTCEGAACPLWRPLHERYRPPERSQLNGRTTQVPGTGSRPSPTGGSAKRNKLEGEKHLRLEVVIWIMIHGPDPRIVKSARK